MYQDDFAVSQPQDLPPAAADVSAMLDQFEQFFALERQQREARLASLESKQQSLEHMSRVAQDTESKFSVLAARQQEMIALQQRQQQQQQRQQQPDAAFLHDKCVALARALAKMTTERDSLDRQLLQAQRQLEEARSRSTRSQQSSMHSHAQFEIWRREVQSLRAALEAHVASDRQDRQSARQEKEAVLNEVVEELGQVMAQRDLAFIEIEKMRRMQQHASATPALTVEAETAEKQIAALQLQLAHARRDVTMTSVNLHVAQERRSALCSDVEKSCRAIQTTAEHCARATAMLQEQQTNLALRGACTFTPAQVAELLLFVSRATSDLSSISSMLAEMRRSSSGDAGAAAPLQLT